MVKAVADDEDKIIILIKDTGIGISAESRDLIFNEFRQASEGFNRKYEGSGLGLTITKKFIKLLGGNLEFESTVGKGSIFKVILPEKSEIPEMHFENEPTERVLSKKIIHSEVGENLKALPKILIVEDDPNTVSLFKIYLKEQRSF